MGKRNYKTIQIIHFPARRTTFIFSFIFIILIKLLTVKSFPIPNDTTRNNDTSVTGTNSTTGDTTQIDSGKGSVIPPDPNPSGVAVPSTLQNSSSGGGNDRANSGDNSKSKSKVVFVGTLCGKGSYWDPNLRVCIPIGNGSPSASTTAIDNQKRQGKNRVRTSAELPDPNPKVGKPQAKSKNGTSSRNNNTTVKLQLDLDEDITEMVDHHCGVGYEWSPEDKLCARYQE